MKTHKQSTSGKRVKFLRSQKPLTAAICSFVHHKGWCESFHREVLVNDGWHTGCPFKDTAILALFPPIIIGEIANDEIAKALQTPGIIKVGDSLP